MRRLRALECTIPFRINLQRVFHSSMVSPGTYANLLALYRCTVSVAIKRFSSIFNLYRCSFRFGPPLVYFCSFSPLFFPFFYFISAQRGVRCTVFTRKLFCCLEREFRMREQSRINLPGFCVSKRIHASCSSVYAVLQSRNYKNTIRADQPLLPPAPRWKTRRYACEMIYSTVSTLPVRRQ